MPEFNDQAPGRLNNLCLNYLHSGPCQVWQSYLGVTWMHDWWTRRAEPDATYCITLQNV